MITAIMIEHPSAGINVLGDQHRASAYARAPEGMKQFEDALKGAAGGKEDKK